MVETGHQNDPSKNANVENVLYIVVTPNISGAHCAHLSEFSFYSDYEKEKKMKKFNINARLYNAP